MTSRDTARIQVGGQTVVADLDGTGSEAILCVHGLASHRAALGPLVDVVADHGYVGLAPDLRGHGQSEGLRGRLSRERVLEDLDAWRDWLAARDVRVRGIVGHSLGGLWALAAQSSLGADVLGLVATPASILRELGALEEVAYRLGAGLQSLADTLGFHLRVPYRVSLEDTLETEEAIQRARDQDLVLGTLPLANVDDLLAVDGPRWARSVNAATVVAHPERDRLVSRESTRALYEALPDPKRWLELDGPHSCFFDRTGEACARRVMQAVDEITDP